MYFVSDPSSLIPLFSFIVLLFNLIIPLFSLSVLLFSLIGMLDIFVMAVSCFSFQTFL